MPVKCIVRPDAVGREPARKSLKAAPVCLPAMTARRIAVLQPDSLMLMRDTSGTTNGFDSSTDRRDKPDYHELRSEAVNIAMNSQVTRRDLIDVNEDVNVPDEAQDRRNRAVHATVAPISQRDGK